MTSYDTLPPIAVGELLNIQLRTARVLTVSEDRRYMQVETPTGYRLLIDRARLAIDRVAPKEWPPQIGDVWVDQHGDEWVGAAAGQGDVWLAYLDNARGTWESPDDALRKVGPMRLLRRRDWTPDEPDEKPVEVDERTAYVARLRAVADFVESRTDLPAPNDSFHTQHSVLGLDAAARFAEVERVAAILGVEPISDGQTVRYDIVDGATYVVHTYGPKPEPEPAPVDEEADVDTWEHEGGQTLVDDGDPAVATVLHLEVPGWVRGFENNQLAAGEPPTEPIAEPDLTTCTAWLLEPGVGHTHTCALLDLAVVGGSSSHRGNHLCSQDGCGRQWLNEEEPTAEIPTLPADLGQHDDVQDRGIL